MDEGDPAALKKEYLDIIISDVRTTNGLGLSVQILGTEGFFLLLSTLGFSGVRKFSEYLTIFFFDNRDCFPRETYERVRVVSQDGRAGAR